ncbi:MAG: ATP-binding cassette domain-containing protein, partial [Opitutae bacterium]
MSTDKTATTTLTLRNVTKRFEGAAGRVTAVEDISLDVREGEFLVLVGPSGCGKST